MDKKKRLHQNMIEFLQEGPKTEDEILAALSSIKSDDKSRKYKESAFRHAKAEANNLLSSYGIEIKKYPKNSKFKDHYGFKNIQTGEYVSFQSEDVDNLLLGNNRTISRIVIMKIMAEKGKTISLIDLSNEYFSELFEDYDEDKANQISNKKNLSPKDIEELEETKRKKRVKRILDEEAEGVNGLIQDGYIVKKNGGYNITDKALIFLELDDDEIYQIEESIQTVGKSYPLQDTLQDFDRKLSFMIEASNWENYHYLKSGVRGNRDDGINNWLIKLNKYDYKNYALRIHYITKSSGESKTVDFKTGMLVYVYDKDKLYLMGENIDKAIDTCIDTETIESIEKIDKQNNLYGQEKYRVIFDEMFSISAESPMKDIKVEFDNAFSIYEKLEKMIKYRKNATLDVDEDKNIIIYREKSMRGLEDFARYLRGFGSSARVISPPELREKMVDSVNNTLQFYQEEGLL